MDKNAEFLNYIYQNAQMGVETIGQLKEIVKDIPFLSQLDSQFKEYEDIKREAENLLKKSGNTEKDIPKIEQVMAYMSISMKTMLNSSTSYIAEMLVKGSNMGIIDITKNLNKYQGAEGGIVKLGEKLLETEERNLEKLKEYL